MEEIALERSEALLATLQEARAAVNKVILGQEQVVDELFLAILSAGHVLIQHVHLLTGHGRRQEFTGHLLLARDDNALLALHTHRCGSVRDGGVCRRVAADP